MAAFWDWVPSGFLEDLLLRGAHFLRHNDGNGGSTHLLNVGLLYETVHITEGCHLHTRHRENLKSRG
jgi:hypothetical protein